MLQILVSFTILRGPLFIKLTFLFFWVCFDLSDEVSAIVVDLGSHTCKAGYAGEDAPKAVFPSVRIVSLLLSGISSFKCDVDGVCLSFVKKTLTKFTMLPFLLVSESIRSFILGIETYCKPGTFVS